MKKKDEGEAILFGIVILVLMFFCLLALFNVRFEKEVITKNKIIKLKAVYENQHHYWQDMVANSRGFIPGTFTYSCTKGVAIDNVLNKPPRLQHIRFSGTGACEISYKYNGFKLKWF